MLKKETSDKLKALGFDVDKLIASIISDKEEDFAVPEGAILTKEQLEARDKQSKAEGEKEGEAAARTVLIKEVGKRLGFEPKGERIGDLVTDLQGKINANGDDKLKNLQDQVTLLTTDKENLNKALETANSRIKQVSEDYDIIGDFPTRAPLLNDREYLSAIRSSLEFKEDGVYRDGQLVRDTNTREPLPRKTVLEQYFKERNWLSQAGGAGGSGSAGGGRGGGSSRSDVDGKPKNFTEAQKAWAAQNPENSNPISPEFQSYVQQLAKDNTQFDFNT